MERHGELETKAPKTFSFVYENTEALETADSSVGKITHCTPRKPSAGVVHS